MAQLLVRNIDDALKDELRESARENGRSLEAEVRERLRRSVRSARPITGRSEPERPRDAMTPQGVAVNGDGTHGDGPAARRVGFGTAAAELFRGTGGFEPGDIIEMGLFSIVGELDRPTRRFYAERAQAHGHTMHEEIRAVLADEDVRAVLGHSPTPDPNEFGLGSDIVALFSGRGVTFDEDDLARMEAFRNEPLAPPVSFE